MNILGINAYHGDAAACLVVDGQLVAAAEEERFRRIKHWAGMPREAIRYCLKAGNTTLYEIEHIAVNRDPRASILRKALFAFSKRPALKAIRDRLTNASRIHDLRTVLSEQFSLEKARITAQIHHIEHHRAHLASTFFVSPFESAAVASVDGFGDFVSTMIGRGEGNKIQILSRTTFPHSLGLLYLAMTQYLGFPNYGDEYKIMGLAACGKPEHLEAMRKIVVLKPEGRFSLNLDFFQHQSEGVSMSWENGVPVIGSVFSKEWEKLLGPSRDKDGELTARHANLAASLQVRYEETLFHLLKYLFEHTRLKSLCLAGGCALNSVANGKIDSRSSFQDIYIPPAPGDAGGAIGAAYVVWHEILGQPRSFVLDRPDWGPEFDQREVESVLQRRGSDLAKARCRINSFSNSLECCRWAAERISQGKVLGWFQGRMEFGARALGHRSIVADPRRPEMKEVLNARIKRRESFRPFAPSILEEAIGDYFEQTNPSPFMTMTYRVKPEKQSIIPAPTHIDGSGRLQSVIRRIDPLYWQLIKEFEELTGVPVLLNTSFNENEPIVCTPEEGLDCFLRTKMDGLVLGSFGIEACRQS